MLTSSPHPFRSKEKYESLQQDQVPQQSLIPQVTISILDRSYNFVYRTTLLILRMARRRSWPRSSVRLHTTTSVATMTVTCKFQSDTLKLINDAWYAAEEQITDE